MDQEVELVTVESYRFLPEAEAAKMHLEAQGIEVYLSDAETVNMDWFLGNAIGFIKLQVPSSQAEQAAAILGEIHPTPIEGPGDDADAEGTACLSCGARMPEDATRCPACGWSFQDDGA